MINTQLISQIASTQKNDLKSDNTLKDKISKDNPKEALAQALKQNLGLKQNASSEEILTKFIQNETSVKLKELINKLLEQIDAQKNPDSPMLKQGKNLNLAPNFANELKNLSTELAKNDVFTQVLEKLNQILKPASEIKNNNLAPLLKNSGVFLEAKLRDALNEELLPKSFHSLLSTIKGLSNEKLNTQIAQLINANLNPKNALNELKNIINNNKNENKQIIDQSSFKILLKLGSKIENFKNYISKNPIHAQEKIISIADQISKELKSIKNDFLKILNKPENIMVKDINILKQTANAFEKLEDILKNILSNQASKTSSKENIKDYFSQIAKEQKESTLQETQKNTKKEETSHKQNEKNKQEILEDKPTNTSENKNLNLKNEKENLKFYEIKAENKTINSNNQNNLSNNNIQNTSQTDYNLLKQNTIKNLAFDIENLDLEQIQNLSKNLNHLNRKLNESLKELDPNTQNAKINQNELKILENKLDLSIKDLIQIKPKTDQDIAESLHHDVKSTLLQISNLAKNEANEAIYNQANRLLAQIEINQLMSLANDSINTYLPFSWEDLSDSKIMFRRGKKNKFFAQIKLEFSKLGDLEILISLNNEKYIDINIMAENKEFRKTIYENAHELKRNINKAGLLSANFFVGDIIRSKFDTRNIKNLDLEMGMDKKV